MTSKRFDVLAPDVHGSWVPAVMTIDTVSARSDTLTVTVDSTRGTGGRLFQAQVYSERENHGSLLMYIPPQGYSKVEFNLDRVPPVEGPRHTYTVASIMVDEILQATRQLRRSKPRTPLPKTANDEVLTCVSCGMSVMSRGSDREGWKGLQMNPESVLVDYYCNKNICIERRDAAIEVAKANWGLSTPEVQGTPEPIKNEEKKAEGQSPYGPPPEKPFL